MAKAEAHCEDCDSKFEVLFESLEEGSDPIEDDFEIQPDSLVIEFCPFCGAELDPSEVIYDDV
jgi:hypothetical protein